MDVRDWLARWGLDLAAVRQQLYAAPQARERERWHALWLWCQGWTQVQIARALEREPHTIGAWLEAFRQRGAAGLQFAATGGSPPPSTRPSSRR